MSDAYEIKLTCKQGVGLYIPPRLLRIGGETFAVINGLPGEEEWYTPGEWIAWQLSWAMGAWARGMERPDG